MPVITALHPLDQPFGGKRGVDWLREGLAGNFQTLRLAVAYAKEGELLRLRQAFEGFRARGGVIEAVLGIDQCVTSRQALSFALSHFTRTKVWQHPNLLVTFHPKLYLFIGQTAAESVVGSCNLTVGGLETNCETAIRLQYSLPDEQVPWKEMASGWTALFNHANARQLTPALLTQLEAAGLLQDEAVTSKVGPLIGQKTFSGISLSFPATPFVPPSPRPMLPKPPTKGTKAKKPKKGKQVVVVPSPVPASLPNALLIQIRPHPNGEVFLSKLAVNESPGFFGYPFTGWTTPKKKNRPYPQRVPDPITDWITYDANGTPSLVVRGFALNTVYYTKKAEIRVTVNPTLRAAIQPDSILQMTRTAPVSGVDYCCEVFPPTSPQYIQLLAACNRTMPSGGQGSPRRFGWI